MTYIPTTDFALEVALGNVPGYSHINKFGQALDCDNNITTDIWDGADGATSTDKWVAPTQARIHALVSGNDEDGGAGTDTGMLTCQVYGLADWDTAESSEIVTLNGTTPVNTSGSYVIIHRIKGLTWGSAKVNLGIITATAATDGTVTAAIQASKNQTLMAIYGVPSTQKLALTTIHADVQAFAASVDVTGVLLVQENVDSADSAFVVKEPFHFTQLKDLDREYVNRKIFNGPCIIKVQVVADQNNTVINAAFDGYVVDN